MLHFLFGLILSFNAVKTIVADDAKLSSQLSDMFLVGDTWMVMYATYIPVSYTSFSYKKLGPSDISFNKSNEECLIL